MKSFLLRFITYTNHWLGNNPFLAFALFSLLYFLGAGGIAYSKPFWYDELYSWHIAQLPNFSDIWNPYAAGDPHPPLFYIFIRFFQWSFGERELATRLPSILGLWLGMLLLFLFIKRRYGSLVACQGILFLALTPCYKYAFEARPYALIIACCCLGLFCWQLATEHICRKWALFGLGFSLGVGLFLHFYAVLLFVPLGIGELSRSFRSKSIDWPIWIAMALGASLIIPLIPLILKVKENSGFFWAKPTLHYLAFSINWLLPFRISRWFYGIIFFLGVLRIWFIPTPDNRRNSRGLTPPPHELIAALVLMLLPFFGFLIAKFLTNAFTPRYFLPAAVGLALVFSFLVYQANFSHPWVSPVVIITLLSLFIFRQAGDFCGLTGGKPGMDKAVMQILSTTGDDPIVIVDAHSFLEFFHYVPPSLKKRLFYLTNLKAAIRYTGWDSNDRSLSALSNKVPLGVENYHSFLSSHERFYLFSNACGKNRPSWVVPQLLEDGARFTGKRERNGYIVQEVFINLASSPVLKKPKIVSGLKEKKL
jgi:hypothetical protein